MCLYFGRLNDVQFYGYVYTYSMSISRNIVGKHIYRYMYMCLYVGCPVYELGSEDRPPQRHAFLRAHR